MTMQAKIRWKETANYTTIIEIDETAVWQFLRDERDADETVAPLRDHLEDEDVQRYLDQNEDVWFERADTNRDYDATTDRAVLEITISEEDGNG